MRFHLIFFGLLVTSLLYSQPHAELIDSLYNGMTVNLEHGDRFDIKIDKIRINGFNYVYGTIYNGLAAYNLLPKKYPTVYKKIIFVLERNNTLIVVNDLRDQFQGESGEYKMYINVNTYQDIEMLGTIFILNKENHLRRNKYNKVATGVLRRKGSSSSLYIDDCGYEWRKINQFQNLSHDISNNIKFLRVAEGGGEFETIRKKINSENWFSDEFHGTNVTSGTYLGTYNFGKTNEILLHKFFDYDTHKDSSWGNDYFDYQQNNSCDDKFMSSTLFLIDRSGSMSKKGLSGKSKILEAKEAAINTLNSMVNSSTVTQEASFLTFSGSCIDDPTANQTLNFSSDVQQLQNSINAIPAPNGGTPLKEAIDAATQRLQIYISQKEGNQVAKLIILSDGVSSCNKIRPLDVYSKELTYSPSKVFSKEKVVIKYYTIGFDIKPGSEAERDLQYLAQQSGGKYLNAKNELELTRAFQRFFKKYTPKKTPISIDLSKKQNTRFNDGIEYVNKGNYREARELFKELSTAHANDYNIMFNLALMHEANNYFIHAIEMFKKYLQLNPSAKDYEWVLQQIELLENDFKIFLEYTRNIVNKDLEYLNVYFKKVQNGESLKLAEEFKGFINEKVEYYKNLPEILNIGNKQFVINCMEISRLLNKCSKIIRKYSTNWDKNATPFLSQVYLNLKRLAENW